MTQPPRVPADDRGMDADRTTQPIPTASITLTTTPEKLERWRAFASARGIDDVALWLEVLADNTLALADVAKATGALVSGAR